MEAYFSGTRSDANVYVAPVASSIHKIAILPLKAPTELIGSSVADIVVTEMMRAGRYTLVERGQMSQVLGEAELALAGLSESAAVEVGKMMGADGVVIGTVDEYGMVAHRGRSYPVVGVSLRLIDCDSGRVMWSVGHARRGNDPAGTLSSHARAVVHEVVAAVVQYWRVQRQVGEKYDDARGTRDRPDDLVGMHGDPVAPTAHAFEPPQAPDSVAISDFGLREVRLQWTPRRPFHSIPRGAGGKPRRPVCGFGHAGRCPRRIRGQRHRARPAARCRHILLSPHRDRTRWPGKRARRRAGKHDCTTAGTARGAPGAYPRRPRGSTAVGRPQQRRRHVLPSRTGCGQR